MGADVVSALVGGEDLRGQARGSGEAPRESAKRWVAGCKKSTETGMRSATSCSRDRGEPLLFLAAVTGLEPGWLMYLAWT